MAEELRLALTIIGVLAIVGIFGHGIWSVRKGKEGLRDMKKPLPRHEPNGDPLSSAQDSGLDVHGVGKPRTVSSASIKKEPVFSEEPQNHGHDSKDYVDDPILSMSALDQTVADPYDKAFDESFNTDQSHQGSAADHHPTSNENINGNRQSISGSSASTASTTSAKAASSAASSSSAAAPPSEVLILHVGMPNNQMISGASLLPQLISMGFKFGEMDIFHRHENTTGVGPVMFSLANMYNPGTFDIDNMEQSQIKGLSLFMTLPCYGDALQNFNMMHNAAKKVAEEFNAQILDSQRSVMTVQTVRHYVEKIREFERKQLING